MTSIQKYSFFFENKKNKKAQESAEPYWWDEDDTPPPYQKYKLPYTKTKKTSDQGEQLEIPFEDLKSKEKEKEDILKKIRDGLGKKKEKKKVKKSELEKHPFFKYIPKDILDVIIRKEEVEEDDIIYNIDELPIQVGDYVKCEDHSDLNENQIEFLKAKQIHKVKSVCDSRGRFYAKGEPHIDLGYKIPFKMFRFKKIDKEVEAKYKILFLQFDLPIDTHGEKDKHNFFRGQKTLSDLFPILFREKLPDSFVDFCTYDDVYRINDDYYIDNMKIREYDFVFFGFMANFSTIVKMLIHYLDRYNIPYLKYGTYKDLDNKAYEMHLLQSLGYPYIPSIMATKLTRKVLDSVKEFGFPVVVKDVNLNRGEGVYKVDNMDQLMDTFKYSNRLMLIQKFVPNDGDYRVISIKNKVELVIKKERIKGSKEFRANVARGGKAVKGSLPPDILAMCEDISKHLICDIVGFDVIQNKVTGEYFIMEANSSPHFPTFAVISEIDIPGIICEYIIRKIKK